MASEPYKIVLSVTVMTVFIYLDSCMFENGILF